MDGVRWMRFGDFTAGEQPEGYRGKGKAQATQIRNMLPSRVDGSLTVRDGHSVINNGGTTPKLGPIRKMKEFTRRNDAGLEPVDPVVMLHGLDNTVPANAGTLAYQSGSSNTYVSVRDSLGGTGSAGEWLDMESHLNSLVAVTHSVDPFVWTGVGSANFPDVACHYAWQHWGAMGPSALFLINSYGNYVGATPGPFHQGDSRYYLFEYEFTNRGRGASVFDQNFPGLRLTYKFPTPGSMRILTPPFPTPNGTHTALGVVACHVYGTRIIPSGDDWVPESQADFFYIGRATVTGAGNVTTPGSYVEDNIPDDRLTFEQPFLGPPLALPRARQVVSHQGRLILGELRSSRIVFGVSPSIPTQTTLGTGKSVWIQFLADSTSAPSRLFLRAHSDDTNLQDVVYEVTTNSAPQTIKDVVDGFNKKAALRVQPGNDPSLNMNPGDCNAAAMLILLGDPEATFLDRGTEAPSTPKTLDKFFVLLDESAVPTSSTVTNVDISADYPNVTSPGVSLVSGVQMRLFKWTDGGTAVTTWNPTTFMHAGPTSGQTGRTYPSSIVATHIDRPWIPDFGTMTPVGTDANDPLWGLVPYQGVSGKAEILALKRRVPHVIVGDWIETDGVVDFAIRPVGGPSSSVGLHRRNMYAASPNGVYFGSYRGLEFFNGSAITPVPLTENMRFDWVSSMADTGNGDIMSMCWWDGAVYWTGWSYQAPAGVDEAPFAHAGGRFRLYRYDEVIARERGNPWISLTEHHVGLNEGDDAMGAGLRSMTVWHTNDNAISTNGRGGILLGATYSGSLWQMFNPAKQVDSNLPIIAFVRVRTVEPQPGHRVRFRYGRPRFKSHKTYCTLQWRFDDRSFNAPVGLENDQSGTGTHYYDERMPLVAAGASTNPRARRVEYMWTSTGTLNAAGDPLPVDGTAVPPTFYGIDIGFVPSEGGLVGATQ